jgi:hypothetical protein
MKSVAFAHVSNFSRTWIAPTAWGAGGINRDSVEDRALDCGGPRFVRPRGHPGTGAADPVACTSRRCGPRNLARSHDYISVP